DRQGGRGDAGLHRPGHAPPDRRLRLHLGRAGAEPGRDVPGAFGAARGRGPGHRLPAVLPGAPGQPHLRAGAGAGAGRPGRRLRGPPDPILDTADSLRETIAMTLFGLDLNATRARAVGGAVGDFPWVAPLAGPLPELPLALCLEGRTPEVGAAGLRL